MKSTLLAVAFATAFIPLFACDKCGCSGSGGGGLDLLPQQNKSMVGIKWDYSTFASITSKTDGAITNTTERYNTLQLVGKYKVTERILLFASVPYRFMRQQTDSVRLHNNGLGDASLFAQFLLLNPKLCNGRNDKHQLRLGGGIKLPTGTFNKVESGTVLVPYLQNGTGSVDVSFSATYNFRYKNYGLNFDQNYLLNTANKNHWRFGDRYVAALQFLYFYQKRIVSLTPSMGLNIENLQQDKTYGVAIYSSGGSRLSGYIGAELSVKHFSFAAYYRPPFWQNIIGTNSGNKLSMQMAVFYSF